MADHPSPGETLDQTVREIETLWRSLSEMLGSAPVAAFFAAAIAKYPLDSAVRRVSVGPQGVAFQPLPGDAAEAIEDLHGLEERVLAELELMVGRSMLERLHGKLHAGRAAA